MCGFAGIVSKNSDSKSKVDMMSSMIKHRGPDSKGSYSDDNVALGFRRLSIIDLSDMGSQPMLINGHAIVFNGEIYNYKELRKVLEQNGFEFQSSTDTEVLLNSYIYWGKDILKIIKGMFAFAIWNLEDNILFMARDHFGKKPFYYSLQGNEFIFCSEIKPVQYALSSKPKIDQSSLVNYLIKGYYNPSKTIYENIFTLGAGQYGVYDFKSNILNFNTYWKNQFNLSYTNSNVEEIIPDVNVALEDAIKRRFVSDVPVGLALSGGIDSSLIAAKSSEILYKNINTYSISFPGSEYDEYKYVKELVKNFPKLNSIRINQKKINLKETIDDLVECFGEPFGDDSAIPSMALYKELKNYGKVFLTGDGADEIFGGYIDYKLYLLQDRFRSINGITNFCPDSLIFRSILSNTNFRKLGYLLKMLKNDNQLFNFLMHGGWSSYSYSYFDNNNNNVFKLFLDIETEEANNFVKLGDNYISRYLNKNLERLSQQFLVKSDRTSMYSSIELRSPFLDTDVANTTNSLSVDTLFHNNKSKYILKCLMSKYMDNKFINRKKMGFTAPLETWLLNEHNQRWILKSLKNKELIVRSLFSEKAINKLFHNKSYIINNKLRIYRLLFLNQWFRNVYL